MSCWLSEPITDRKLLLQYDTVIDLGTSEHVYNVAQVSKTSLYCVSQEVGLSMYCQPIIG